MADNVKMVVVDGVRYRPEDAPKTRKSDKDEQSTDAEHKMRQPQKAAQRRDEK